MPYGGFSGGHEGFGTSGVGRDWKGGRDMRGAGGFGIDMKDYLGGHFSWGGKPQTTGGWNKAAKAWADRFSDQQNLDATPGEKWGNRVANIFGFHERPTTFDPKNMNNKADWGLDPVGLLGGMAGTAFGMPGLGLLAGGVSGLLGHPLEFNLGPDVFGGPGPSSGPGPGTGPSGGSWGGQDWGVSNHDNGARPWMWAQHMRPRMPRVPQIPRPMQPGSMFHSY